MNNESVLTLFISIMPPPFCRCCACRDTRDCDFQGRVHLGGGMWVQRNTVYCLACKYESFCRRFGELFLFGVMRSQACHVNG